MKKVGFLLLSFLLCFSSYTNAARTKVTIRRGENSMQKNRNRAPAKNVGNGIDLSYEDNIFYLSVPEPMGDVSIIIKDFDGNVLYSTAIFVSTSDVFTVPESIIDDMCLIEITYKDVCYKGSL